MRQEVNYIEHHLNANLKLIDKKLSSSHISLYNALFLIWNQCGFDTDLSINRNDVMKLSKIGSANTYTKCLKDLDKEGLIKYNPSYNPLVGSKINMYRFDKGSDKGSGKGSVKSSSKGSDKASATLSKQLNNKTIKLLNNNASLVNSNLEKWIDTEINNEENDNNEIKKKKKPFNFRLSLIDLGVEEKIADAWIEVRKKKRSVNTEIAFEAIKNQIEKSKQTPNECIKVSVENSWAGFKSSWIDNLNTPSNNSKYESRTGHVHVTKKVTDLDFVDPNNL